MHYKNLIISMTLTILSTVTVIGQNEAIVVEADSGIIGSDFNLSEEEGVRYMTITTNGIDQFPESAARVFTLIINFPDTGSYDLYARVRVGSNSADDDSFFYGSEFGIRDTINADHWTRVNNIFGAGYTTESSIVDGFGGAPTEVWKWINLSEYTGDEFGIIFNVTDTNLVDTLQFGAREDGLDFDKIAFGKSYLYYTVGNLDNGEPGSADPPVIMDTLGDPIATGKCKFLGSAYSAAQSPYFEHYWNQVTPENAGKWGSVEGTRDNMSWSGLDNAYDFAKENDFMFKLHVLVWGSQQPGWIDTIPVPEQLEEVEEWFAAVAERYDSIDMIEVVNEPLHAPPAYMEALGGGGARGWDWILESFRMARTYFPGVDLIINDYGIIGSATATNQYLEIIELLQAEDTLIDGIGLQAHAFSTFGAGASTIKNNLDNLGVTGLPIYITELDIDGATDEVQINEYQRIFPVIWEHPSVKGVTLWGYRIGLWRTSQDAYLINEDGTYRPAFEWLINYIEDLEFDNECMLPVVPIEEESISNNNGGIHVYPVPAIDGRFTIDGLDDITYIKIIDVTGRSLKEIETLNTSSVEVTLNVQPGLYVIELFRYSESIIHRNIIIQ